MSADDAADRDMAEAAEAEQKASEELREKLDRSPSGAGPHEPADAPELGVSARVRGLSREETEAVRDRLDASTAPTGGDLPEANNGESRVQGRDLKDRVREGIDRERPAEGERHTFGSHEVDKLYRKEQHGPTCAIAAQEGVIEKHTGIDPGEKQLQGEAVRNGWTFEDGGSREECLGNVLEAHGIPVERSNYKDGSAGMHALKNELAQDHDVIVNVDGGKLYHEAGKDGGHALWVTEVDESQNPPRVYVNDSNTGTPESYTAPEFMEAWRETDCTMVATKKSAWKA
jgi:hypothetical protein